MSSSHSLSGQRPYTPPPLTAYVRRSLPHSNRLGCSRFRKPRSPPYVMNLVRSLQVRSQRQSKHPTQSPEIRTTGASGGVRIWHGMYDTVWLTSTYSPARPRGLVLPSLPSSRNSDPSSRLQDPTSHLPSIPASLYTRQAIFPSRVRTSPSHNQIMRTHPRALTADGIHPSTAAA